MPSSDCHASPDWPNERNVMLLALAELPPMSMVLRTPGACCSSAKNPTRPVGVVSSISVVRRVLVAVDVTSTTGEAPRDGDRFLERADLQLHVDRAP